MFAELGVHPRLIHVDTPKLGSTQVCRTIQATTIAIKVRIFTIGSPAGSSIQHESNIKFAGTITIDLPRLGTSVTPGVGFSLLGRGRKLLIVGVCCAVGLKGVTRLQ